MRFFANAFGRCFSKDLHKNCHCVLQQSSPFQILIFGTSTEIFHRVAFGRTEQKRQYFKVNLLLMNTAPISRKASFTPRSAKHVSVRRSADIKL